MTLKEAKIKALAMIEELNPNSELLTDDPDIAAKINGVFNQVMFELIRLKKIAKYVEMDVSKGDLIEFADIEKACGYEVFQIANVSGVDYVPKANGSVLKILSDGVAEIDVYVYPEKITATTKDSYEFEIPADLLEILPYGVAGDLLKSDISAEYGQIYAKRYEEMLQRIDPRNAMTSIFFDGGVNL